MRQLAKLSVITIVVSSITGCSWLWGDKGFFRDRSNDYLQAKQAPFIVVPSNLEKNTRSLDPLYPIPNFVPDSTAGKNFEVPRPVALQAVKDNSEFSLQNNKGVQWFIARQLPNQIYPQVFQYFQQAGFHIDTSRPEVGEFTTDWIKVSNLTNALANRLLALDPSLKKRSLKVRVRVEPGVQSNTSEVYTLIMVRSSDSLENQPWPEKSQSVSAESVFLDELMANMSNTQSDNTTVSLLADGKVPKNTSISLVKNADNIPVLVVNGDFDLVWSRVEEAITAADVKIEDMDRTTGAYYINLSESASNNDKGFFKKLFDSSAKPKDAKRYIIKLTQLTDNINISVLDPKDNNALATDIAELILKRLQESMK